MAISDRRWFVRLLFVAVLVLVNNFGANAHQQSTFPTELNADRIQATVLEIRLAETQAAPGLVAAELRNSPDRLFLHAARLLTNSDIVQARVISSGERFNVSLTLSVEAASRMADATSAHQGRPLAIIVDGEIVAAPIVRGRITTEAVISADLSQAEAEAIVSGLRR